MNSCSKMSIISSEYSVCLLNSLIAEILADGVAPVAFASILPNFWSIIQKYNVNFTLVRLFPSKRLLP